MIVEAQEGDALDDVSLLFEEKGIGVANTVQPRSSGASPAQSSPPAQLQIT